MEDINIKQNFLRNNILDKGYDSELFMSCLQKKKGTEEIDLNDWSLDELKKIVNEFINDNNVKKQNNNNIQKYKPHPIKIGEFNEHEIFENDNYFQKYIFKNENKILCKKNDETYITKLKNIKINFNHPLIVDKGFFSRKYVVYCLNVIPFNSNIKRRYSDFEWLRNIMSDLYPNTVIPPLPKNNIFDQFKDDFIANRLKKIKRFINGMVIHPILKNSQIFYDFLTIQDENEFNDAKNQYNKIKNPQLLTDYKTVNGEIDVTLDKDKEKLFDVIKESRSNYLSKLSNIMNAYDELMSSFKKISEQMKMISNMWLEMKTLCEKYNDNIYTINSYENLSRLMNQWHETEKKNAEFIDEELKEYYKYIEKEYYSVESLINKVEVTKNDFYKEANNLMAKKNSLFEDCDIANWAIEDNNDKKDELLNNKEYAFSKMLPNETKVVINHRNFYSLYLNSLINEYNRLKELNGKRNNQTNKDFCLKLIENICMFNTTLFEISDSYKVEKIDEKEEEKKIIDEYKEILKQEKENQFKKPNDIF